MNEYSYDQIYGVDLNAYMDRLGLSLEDLFLKTTTDIKFLKENLKREVQKDNPDEYLVTVIFNTIEKKEKHLQRMKEWAKIYCSHEYKLLKESDAWKNEL